MANIYIPYLNPIRFVEEGKTNLPQYSTKQFDDFLFAQQQYDWEQPTNYCQKFYVNDILKLQFQADVDPLQLSIVNSDDDIVSTFTANPILRSQYNPTLFVYEVAINLSTLAVGCYKIKLEIGSPVTKTLISENIEIIDDIENLS